LSCDFVLYCTADDRKAMAKKISVILPVYNESECITATFESVLEYSQNHPSYHFIFVNDGSNDETQEILTSQNQGKGYAIKKGVEASSGDYICFLDSDLAYSLSHLEFLIDKLEVFDVVMGCRNQIFDNFKRVKLIRLLAGKIFNVMTQSILSLNFSDMQAGLKGFRRDAAENLFEKQTIKRFCFDVELIYLAHKRGYRIGEIPAIVSNTHISKVSKVNLLIDSIRMLQSLIQIRINERLGLYEEVCLVKL